MINAGYTLLMNSIKAPVEIPIPIDSSFVPVQLPGSLQAIRNVIFGAKQQPLFCGLRAVQLLKLLQTYPYCNFLSNLDQRVTYDINNISLTDIFGVTQASASNVVANVIGKSVADSARGIARFSWTVTTSAGPQVSVSLDGSSSTHSVTFSAGTTSAFALSRTSLTASLTFPDGSFLDDVLLQLTSIQSVLPITMATLAILEKVVSPQLFTGIYEGSQLQDWWKSPIFPNRIAGVSLALIQQEALL